MFCTGFDSVSSSFRWVSVMTDVFGFSLVF